MIKEWLLEKEKNRWSATLWNAVACGVFAIQSAVLLIVVSRIFSQVVAGMFSLAYAIANIAMTVGKYGERNYQITDYNPDNTFKAYLVTRWVTVCCTSLVLVCYLLYQYQIGRYTQEKVILIVLIAMLKMIDAMVDVWFGEYQRKGYFLSAVKIMAVQQMVTTISILIMLAVAKDAVYALVVGNLVSVASVMVGLHESREAIEARQSLKWKSVREILGKCMPLCIGTSLAIYVGNLPKYAIDAYADEVTQAIFGYLMLPVFVITLLNQFIFQPYIKQLSDMWVNGDRHGYIKKICQQCLVILIIGIGVMLLGLILGLPILSWLYNVELGGYWREFLILLWGGIALAYATYMTIPLTIMRKQNVVALAYGISAVLGGLGQRKLVADNGMMGASVLYAIVTVIVMLVMIVTVGIEIKNTLIKK